MILQNVTTRVTTTTTTRQRREGINTRVVAQIDQESIGDRLRSTALIPFMRQKNINFVAEGMKPLTRVYPFFDKVPVASFTTPTGGSLGGALITDGNGTVTGLFQIPNPNTAGNPRFKTGERLFRLTSSNTNATVPEPETFAQAPFTSTGILRTIQEEIIATRNGRIETQRVAENRTLTSQSVNSSSNENLIGGACLTLSSDPAARTFDIFFVLVILTTISSCLVFSPITCPV